MSENVGRHGLDDEAEIDQPRNRVAVIVVVVLGLGLLALGLRAAMPGGKTGSASTAPEPERIEPAPDTTQATVTFLEPAAATAESAFLKDGGFDDAYDLDIDVVVGISSYDSEGLILDLSNGAFSVLDDQRVLAITDNYFVVADWMLDTTDSTALQVIDRVTRQVVSEAVVDGYPQDAIAAAGPDQFWVEVLTTAGVGFNLVDAASGRIVGPEALDEEVPIDASLVERPGSEPYVNVPAAGVFDPDDGSLTFVGEGEVLASSEGVELWSRCSDSLECELVLLTGGSEQVLALDRQPGLGQLDSPKLSPEGDVLVWSDVQDGTPWRTDLRSMTSTEIAGPGVWYSYQATFAGRHLLVAEYNELVVINLDTGDERRVALPGGSERIVVTGPRFDG